MSIKEKFLYLLKKYDCEIEEMSEEDDNILWDCFAECKIKNLNPFIIMGEARDEYEISKTDRRYEARN